jgi:hypothetical protein
MFDDWLYVLAFFPFYAADWALTAAGVASPYYLLHALHNAAVVVMTWPDVVATVTDVHGLSAYPANVGAAALVTGLHVYHIVRYRATLRFDDWLHHALMIGVCIPSGLAFATTPLMGYALFFTTGLPGGISYASLFLQRNGWLERLTEKRINTAMNVWIRSPGCASLAAYVMAYALSRDAATDMWGVGLSTLAATLVAWNGQYFMQQAVADLARRELEEIRHAV